MNKRKIRNRLSKVKLVINVFRLANYFGFNVYHLIDYLKEILELFL